MGEVKELHLISILKEPVTLNKTVHLALVTADFNLFVDALKLVKITYSDWPRTLDNIRADGIMQIFFQDPDGYWIEANSVG